MMVMMMMLVQDNEEGMEGEQQEEEPLPETRIEVEIPKVSTDLGSDLYFVKLPNFLSVEPRCVCVCVRLCVCLCVCL